jgi:transposase
MVYNKKAITFALLKRKKMVTQLNLSSEEMEWLNHERYNYPCPIVQKRFHSIYIKAVTGFSNERVGIMTDAHRNSISEWIQIYQTKGLDGLMQVDYGTNKSELAEHSSSIKELFEQHPPRSIDEAVLKIEKLTGIKRSRSRVSTFIKRLGFRCLKTGHIPAKANDTQQREWVDKTLQPAIEAAQKEETHLLFMDASHFVLQPFLCHVWCLCRIFIKAAAGRNRINVLGAINAITKEVTTYINTTYINADSIMAFLKQLKEKYPDKPIAIVLDNARYQHCVAVKDLAATLGIQLLFLPPYSPNLNIIERLWKFTKKQILNAEYYDTPDKFHEAITTFFQNVNKEHNDELQKTMTLKFQFFDKNIAHYYAA